jgi:hypothetical protein
MVLPVTSDITVAIPTIPPRYQLLARAIRSVSTQTLPADALSVSWDIEHEGAAATRQRALDGVQTGWTAFLDDDDEMLPEHLARLMRHARETDSDYVYSWFETVPAGHDPFPPYHFTNEFNPADPIQTTITILVKTELAKSVRFVPQDDEGKLIRGQRWGEDYEFTLGCIRAGGKISHLVERTWLWHHDSGNTSGRPDRWVS